MQECSLAEKSQLRRQYFLSHNLKLKDYSLYQGIQN